MSHPQAVIVLAAGQGTRMKSSLPKVLHPLAGKPLLWHALQAARGTQPETLVTVVRHQRERLVEYLSQDFPEVVIADQDEVPGTGRAVWCGLQALDSRCSGTVLVTSADVPLLSSNTLTELVEVHEAAGAGVTLVTSKVTNPYGYGRVLRGDDGMAIRVVEEKDATEVQRKITEINAGVYAFDLDFLREVLPTLGTGNAQAEMYLTDTVKIAGDRLLPRPILEVCDTWQVEGCNDLVQRADLENVYRQRLNERWMRQGVSMVDPQTTYIDAEVELAPDVRLEPGVFLVGKTRVHSGVLVGSGSVIRDSEIKSDAQIYNSFVTNTTIGKDEIVGPFAIREGHPTNRRDR